MVLSLVFTQPRHTHFQTLSFSLDIAVRSIEFYEDYQELSIHPRNLLHRPSWLLSRCYGKLGSRVTYREVTGCRCRTLPLPAVTKYPCHCPRACSPMAWQPSNYEMVGMTSGSTSVSPIWWNTPVGCDWSCWNIFEDLNAECHRT